MSQQIMEFLIVGGPVVWLLIIMSVLALTVSVVKILQFWHLGAECDKSVRHALLAWSKHEIDKALKVLSDKRLVDQLVKYCMQAICAKQQDIKSIREEVERRALNQLAQLKNHLRLLEVIATISPLLGLLGTVLGMITAFQQMEAAGSQVDPSVLSGGIWQALLTTAIGLLVAIPALTLHNFLERKVERITHLFNDAITQVFTSTDNQVINEGSN